MSAVDASIRGFYNMVKSGAVESMHSLFTNNANLNWGPFVFEGLNEIKEWATELGHMFPELSFNLGGIVVNDNEAFHKFTMEVTTPSGRRGRINGESKYELRNSKIRRVWIQLYNGYIILKRSELDYFK